MPLIRACCFESLQGKCTAAQNRMCHSMRNPTKIIRVANKCFAVFIVEIINSLLRLSNIFAGKQKIRILALTI